MPQRLRKPEWSGVCFISAWFTITSLLASESFTPQKADPLLERWRWSHVSELDGKGFACMAESDQGLWFGVQNGVLFYDGRTWTSYSAKDGLFDGPVTTLRAAKDGTIWAASRTIISSNLCAFKDGKWRTVTTGGADVPPTGVASIVETDDGAIWAAFLPRPFYAVRYLGDTNSESVILRIKAGECTLYGRSNSPLTQIIPKASFITLPSNVAALAWCYLFKDEQGCLWMAPSPGGTLARWNPQNGPPENADAWQVFNDNLSRRWDPVFLQTRGREVLLGFGNGAKEIHSYNSRQDHWGTALSKIDRVNSLLETRDGTIFAGAHTRLLVRRGESWRTYELDSLGLSTGALRLFETSTGNLWFGTENGSVFRLDCSEQRWISYDSLNFQADDAEGTEWFLHVDGTVVRKQDGDWTRFDAKDGLMSHPVAVFCTKDGQTWAAGSHEGIAATAYFENGQWHRKLHPDLSWTVDYRGVLEAVDGGLWFGANNEPIAGKVFKGGIVRFNKSSATNQWTHLLPPQVPEAVCGITQLPDGRIYYGGWNVSEQQANSWVIITNPPELSTYWVDSVTASASGDLWASRGGVGVFRRHNDVWTRFDSASGLADMMVSTLFCSPDGTVFAATPKGISHFDGKGWTPRSFPTESIAIDRESGNLRQSRNGRLWINSSPRKWFFRAKYGETFTTENLPSFRTIGYLAEHLAPETKLTVASEKVSQPGNTLIAWEGRDPWERTPATLIEFSYRLDNGEWSPYKAETQRMFLALPSGKHTFEVRARDLDFNEDPTPARFEFTVVPPIWRHPWFLALLTALLSVIAAQTIRVLGRDRRLRASNRALAVEVDERKRTEIELRDKTRRLEKEIDERKRMEREVEQAHQELLEASRMAGMAEVATDVLHNVGNALNSINVSVHLLMDNLQKSRTGFVTRVAEMLREHASDLADFLMRDPKGQQLPAYLTSLGKQLDGERAKALAEVEELQKNVDHVKEAVAMQQNHTQVTIVTAKLNVVRLVEDAIRMSEDSLARQNIEIVREFNATREEITADRFKVLQILITLISNAHHACEEIQLPNRRIIIRLTENNETRIRIAVTDNGVGIAPENLIRIFNHGFITRKAGHTFGLHGAALSAKEMGGSLTVQSDGPGKGATFILELPVQTAGDAIALSAS